MLTIIGYTILTVVILVAVLCVIYGKTLNINTNKWEINGLGIFGYVLTGICVVLFLSDGGYDLYNKIIVSSTAQKTLST